jgi:hypothetical protein
MRLPAAPARFELLDLEVLGVAQPRQQRFRDDLRVDPIRPLLDLLPQPCHRLPPLILIHDHASLRAVSAERPTA